MRFPRWLPVPLMAALFDRPECSFRNSVGYKLLQLFVKPSLCLENSDTLRQNVQTKFPKVLTRYKIMLFYIYKAY